MAQAVKVQQEAFDALADDINKFAKINIGRKRNRTGSKSKSGKTRKYTSPINNSGKLRNGFKMSAKVSQSGASVELKLDVKSSVKDYFFTVNEGVQGSISSFRETRNSPFKYKSKNIPQKPLQDWIKKKPIRMRSPKGGFVKMTESKRNGLAYAIGKKIATRGTKPTYFFTEALDDALIKHESDILDTYAIYAKDVVGSIFKNAEIT